MDALVLDFDGVVVDSEPVHLACFQRVLAEEGIVLAADDYYAKYLGYDDRDCFLAVARDQGRALRRPLEALIAAKTALVQQALSESVQPLPGAVELIRSAKAAGVPVAVCSGALRKEIELASAAVGVLGCFTAIVSAEDVSAGKPDPQGFRLVLERLAAACGRPIRPQRCVAVEDSPAGITAARGAGMKVLAVTNSYPPQRLQDAQRVVASLADVDLAELDALL
ncbi:MAG: HAD family phosphatase [Phycisphaerae bacterium]|nr:HAD family phosphatase [Phycisphaerae bacterium]